MIASEVGVGRRKVQPSRMAVVWGALWGAAAGTCVLAPPILRMHDLRPTRVLEWVVLDVALLALFALSGAMLAFYALLPLELWQALTRRRFRHEAWAYRLALPIALAAAYLAVALAVDWGNFQSPEGFEDARASLGVGAVIYLLVCAALPLGYDWLAGRDRARDVRALAGLLGLAAVAGCVLAPWRVGSAPRDVSARDEPIASLPGRASPRPVLLVGLDGGNWRTLRPLLARGALPAFARLAAEGMQGEVEASWPPYWSAPAWAAILTGYDREATGVYEDLVAEVPGLPAFEVPLASTFLLDPFSVELWALVRAGLVTVLPPPRAALHRPPVWEILSAAGVKTAVVRFRFTHPATGQADVVISDWVGRDLWDLVGVPKREGGDVVSPATEAPAVLRTFAARDGDGLAELLPEGDRARPRDTRIDPVAMLRVAAEIDRQTIDATERLLRDHPDLGLVAVYLGGFDNVCHGFWQYRFPEDFPDAGPAAGDVATLGPVIDRYLAFIDRGLDRLVRAHRTPSNVVLLSDHGFEPIRTHVLYKGWHGPRGIFLAAGPDVPRATAPARVSYADVVPTVLDLAGFAKVADMPGTSLVRR